MTKPKFDIPGLAEAQAEIAAVRKIGRIISHLPKPVAMNALGRIMFALQRELQGSAQQPADASTGPRLATGEADPS